MNLALFGGTFNPIHTGHLLMAETARECAKLDQVVFLPTGEPPHKSKPRTTAKHRLAMIRAAIRGNPAFQVSDWEIRQRRTVYTYETLAYFRTRWPTDSLFFIIGSDSLRDVPKWQRGESLLKLATFVVVDRPEAPWRRLPASLRRQALHAPSTPVPFASHELRARVHRGESIRYQVPEAVHAYIAKNRLYRRPE